MHVYTASITTTTILTPAVQNLNVKMSWTDNLYSYIIKININFIKSILYLTYNIPYNCGKKVKIIMKKIIFLMLAVLFACQTAFAGKAAIMKPLGEVDIYRCEQRLFKLDSHQTAP